MTFINLFSRLIAFKTISKKSNEELILFIKNYLSKLGVKAKLLEGSKGQFNLYARVGPNINGGILLSGHTDVVPVDGQNWTTDPFKLIIKNKKFFGRGTCDMKGFIAIVLDLISTVKIENLKKPLHLVFSYDEEIGCVGIQEMVPFLKKLKPKPSYCIVGEPTSMKLVNQHKGKKNFIVEFNGVEAHSSLIDNGVNAITFCAQFVKYLDELQKTIKLENRNQSFLPPYPTINVGTIKGGIALNIIPKLCKIEFEVRDIPGIKIEKILKEINSYLKILEKKMKKINKKSSVRLFMTNDFPPLQTDEKKSIIPIVLKSLKSNTLNSVSFGTEAGVFNKLNIETIVCGPGNIQQAHKPNEFIEQSQVEKCREFLLKLLQHLY